MSKFELKRTPSNSRSSSVAPSVESSENREFKTIGNYKGRNYDPKYKKNKSLPKNEQTSGAVHQPKGPSKEMDSSSEDEPEDRGRSRTRKEETIVDPEVYTEVVKKKNKQKSQRSSSPKYVKSLITHQQNPQKNNSSHTTTSKQPAKKSGASGDEN